LNLYRLARPLLFAQDPEAAHERVMAFLARTSASPRTRARMQQRNAPRAPALRQTLWGLDFPGPIGLAAGMDKSARAPLAWQALGFGFAELGTITPLPQPGNAKPRLWRDARNLALVNQMGFNNDGAAAVAERIATAKPRASIPLGVNLGKQKDTPLDDAARDYRACLDAAGPSAHFVVVNVSSPNTPWLRALQEEARLRALLEPLLARARELGKPLWLKLSPDLAPQELDAAVRVALDLRVAAVVCTNTSAELPKPEGTQGGVSGAPLRARSTEALRRAAQLAQGQLTLVGSGGVFTAEHAYEKVRAGASLVEVYTGFVYEGPSLPRRLHGGLAALLERDGFGSVREAVGADLKERS
jgi:dihydroorotate dehydrogenase